MAERGLHHRQGGALVDRVGGMGVTQPVRGKGDRVRQVLLPEVVSRSLLSLRGEAFARRGDR